MEYKQFGALDFGTPHKTFGGVSVYRDLDIPPTAWLVENLIIEQGHHVAYGYTGMKKTFIAMDLALRLTNGMDYHGRKATPCEVVYVVGEDAPEFTKRQDAWLKHHGKERKVNSIPHPVQFKDGDFGDLIDAVAHYGAGLVIFDNLVDCAVGINLNDNDDYGAAIKPLRKNLTRRTGAATLFLHHTGRSASGGHRGAQAIIDDANLSMKVGAAHGLTSLKLEKLRGATVNQPPLRFRSVQVDQTIVLDTAPSKTKALDAPEADHEKSKPKGNSKAVNVTDIERVRLAVSEYGPTTPATIAKRTGIAYRKVTANLSKLVKRGALVKTDAGYGIATAS